ncbi:MAG: glycogen synthase GlgA [Spartobacteria bacterium]|nr:glycogen synthase GlgA [Spartobacteria bacterium]
MRILFAASEISPYASTGGLADVGRALPLALQADGHETYRVMPCYRQIIEGISDLTDTGIRLPVALGLGKHVAEVWHSESQNPPVFFIRRDEFFDRSNLYSLPYRDYDDNFERFVFFQKSVVALIDALGLQVNIVHCNDWQTGLIPMYLRYGVNGGGRDFGERTVFTIHNLAYQGLYAASRFSSTNLPLSCFSVDGFEYYGQINCMKAGIVASDLVTTVSPSYANEIRTEESGCGLHGVLQAKGDRLVGILNGVDYSTWNPSTDKHLAARYDDKRLEGKERCKEDLRSAMQLKTKPGTPIIGLVTRLTEQKGLDILASAMHTIMEMDVGVAMLGTGEKKYHRLCQAWAKKWPGRFSVRLAFDNAIAHKIEAGADMFLMPSRFEPCGLNQMYSLRYGTLPIVHRTGGLRDTIGELSEDFSEGNGFSFEPYGEEGLLDAVKRALAAYRKQAKWKQVVSRIMCEDFSWNLSAREYARLYEEICR